VNAQTAKQSVSDVAPSSNQKKPTKTNSKDKSQQERLSEAPQSLLEVYNSACQYVEQLGDEVQRKELKLYTAFKSIRNFVSIVVQARKDPRLQMYLKLPGELGEENTFSRDVTQIGHWGTGNLEVNVRTPNDWEKARPLVEKAYQES
jgi:predicted transport protein